MKLWCILFIGEGDFKGIAFLPVTEFCGEGGLIKKNSNRFRISKLLSVEDKSLIFYYHLLFKGHVLCMECKQTVFGDKVHLTV